MLIWDEVFVLPGTSYWFWESGGVLPQVHRGICLAVSSVLTHGCHNNFELTC